MSDLREALAKKIAEFRWDVYYWKSLVTEDKQVCYEQADALLALLREHGLVELDENQDFDAPLVDLWLERMDKAGEDADKVITERDGLEKFGKLKRTQARYAEMSTAFSFCERTMLKAGFRRIKEIA